MAVVASLLASLATAQGPNRLRDSHRAEVAELQPQIDEAIDRGVDFLLSTQLRDGSWSYEQHYFATGQTALCAYTLMKSGLPTSHGAVQRALAFVRAMRPTMVYAVGAQLMALAEAGNPADLPLIEDLAKDLLRWQDGSWAYPNDGTFNHLHRDRDLSITQFAMLGLWAAESAGVKIPKSAWTKAVRAVLGYQEPAKNVEYVPLDGSTSSGTRGVAGFRYRWSARGASSGSMTTAGLACLAIARQQLGGRKMRELDDAIQYGLGWLDHHYTVTENPGGGKDWLYYYLYGLERVGALVDTAYIGAHPWYLDGARELLKLQETDGKWQHRRHAEPDTCFAVLFLKRATASSITGRERADPRLSLAEDASSLVGMRGHGGMDGTPLQLWLTRVGDADENGRVIAPPFVHRVEYLVDGDVVAQMDADSSRSWNGERYPYEHRFARSGTFQISARVHVSATEADSADLVLECPGFELAVRGVLEDWMLGAAARPADNLLRLHEVGVDASSTSRWNDQHTPDRAADQLEDTAWACAPSDEAPALILQFSPPIPISTMVLHQLGGSETSDGKFDSIRQLEVRLKRKGDPIVVDVDPDARLPITVPLKRGIRVRYLELTITARDPGSQHAGVAGFREVLFLR